MKKIRLNIDVSKNRLIIATVISVWVTLAVNANVALIGGTESGEGFLNLITKIANTFSTVNWADILAFIAVFMMTLYVVDRETKHSRCGLITSGILSALYIVSFSYKDTNDVEVLFGNGYQIMLSLFVFIGFWGLLYLGFELIYILIDAKTIREGLNSRILFWISAGVIFVCRMFWILMNYPGSIAGDTIGQLGQWFDEQFNSHHPPLSTFLFGWSVSLGDLIADKNFGVFLYLFLQAVLGSFIMAYCIYVLYRMGCSRGFCVATLLFYALTPMFGVYAQWLQKDMLYSLFTLLYTILLAKLVVERNGGKKEVIVLTVVGIMVSLLRKNGIYCVIPTCVALIFYLGKKEWIRTISMTLATLIVYVTITAGIYPAMGIEDGSVREALCVPMQQTARVIRDHGDDISEEEMLYLSNLSWQLELFAETYDPQCADPIKNICNVEIEHPFNYFRYWLKLGLRHPGTYVSAFLNMNYGYMAPNNQNMEPDLSNTFNEELTGLGFAHTQGDVQIQMLQRLVQINIIFPLLRYLTMPGLYTWIVIICCAVLIKSRRKTGIIIFIPAIMTILVCLASPLCNGMRYELPVCLSAPLLMGIVGTSSSIFSSKL